ncbi:MAG: hypothetical protein IJP03_02105 [Christensenellaceae bacterium]|nr:hypothetical protein [Christensenellaceae bacterium]
MKVSSSPAFAVKVRMHAEGTYIICNKIADLPFSDKPAMKVSLPAFFSKKAGPKAPGSPIIK